MIGGSPREACSPEVDPNPEGSWIFLRTYRFRQLLLSGVSWVSSGFLVSFSFPIDSVRTVLLVPSDHHGEETFGASYRRGTGFSPTPRGGAY